MEMAKLLMMQKQENINKHFCSVFGKKKRQDYMYESGDDGKVLSSSAVTKDNIVCLPGQGRITEQFTKKCGTLNAGSEQRTHLHMWTGSRML